MALFGLLMASASAACSGGAGGEDDDDAGVTEISSGGRRPGGGNTSGGAFNSSGSQGGSSSSSSASSSSGASSSSSSSGGGGGSSSSGSSGCADPNDAPQGDATTFTPFTVGNPSVTLTGVLNDAFDVDWYGYDISGNNASPLVFLPTDRPEIEVCVFVECPVGTLDITCDLGEPLLDGHGRKGCCGRGTATTQGRASGATYCAGATTDDITAYLRISSKAPQCAEYSAKVSF